MKKFLTAFLLLFVGIEPLFAGKLGLQLECEGTKCETMGQRAGCRCYLKFYEKEGNNTDLRSDLMGVFQAFETFTANVNAMTQDKAWAVFNDGFAKDGSITYEGLARACDVAFADIKDDYQKRKKCVGLFEFMLSKYAAETPQIGERCKKYHGGGIGKWIASPTGLVCKVEVCTKENYYIDAKGDDGYSCTWYKENMDDEDISGRKKQVQNLTREYLEELFKSSSALREQYDGYINRFVDEYLERKKQYIAGHTNVNPMDELGLYLNPAATHSRNNEKTRYIEDICNHVLRTKYNSGAVIDLNRSRAETNIWWISTTDLNNEIRLMVKPDSFIKCVDSKAGNKTITLYGTDRSRTNADEICEPVKYGNDTWYYCAKANPKSPDDKLAVEGRAQQVKKYNDNMAYVCSGMSEVEVHQKVADMNAEPFPEPKGDESKEQLNEITKKRNEKLKEWRDMRDDPCYKLYGYSFDERDFKIKHNH